MSTPLRFELHHDEDGSTIGVFLDTDPLNIKAQEMLFGLLERRDDGQLSQNDYIKGLQALVKNAPDYIDGYAHLGSVFYQQSKPKKALDACLQALSIANKHIPEGFQGTIPWDFLENRPYLRAMHGCIQSYIKLKKHKDAALMIERMLEYNPEDNLGARLYLGSEYLRSGVYDKAKIHLQAEADFYPPSSYELALLYLLEGDWISAATTLRRAFIMNPYIAQILWGNLHPIKLLIWHSNNYHEPDIAEHYLALYGEDWFKHLEFIAFVFWLYHHSSVLSERALMLACLEDLFWEDNINKRKGLLKQFDLYYQKIDDTLSREIIVKRKNRSGQNIYPWNAI